MSESAKCPVCGKTPKSYVNIDPVVYSIYCCGHAVTGEGALVKWNKYAAAMELAELLSSLDKCDAKTQHLWEQHVDMAEKRVLEVFK